MITNKQIEAGKNILLKYTLPDALKPEYNGMTAYELVKMILEVAQIENESKDKKISDD